MSFFKDFLQDDVMVCFGLRVVVSLSFLHLCLWLKQWMKTKGESEKEEGKKHSGSWGQRTPGYS